MISWEFGDGWGFIAGIDWRRWYVGAAYETQPPNVRAIVFRFGPLYIHIIAS